MASDGVGPLREKLRKIDMTAPAIQGSAGAMMRLYDRASGVAVVEWRNALQQAQHAQLLPLLYVANEVLQNSKRNRGNKFLEAFSPVLGQSLRFIAEKHSTTPSVIEKVRRTVKIWGDRHVFSVRYVNELLQGLNQFRNGSPPPTRLPSPEPVGFSPVTHSPDPTPPPQPAPSPAKPSTANAMDIDAEMRSGLGGIGIGDDSDTGVGDDSDDDDLFGTGNSDGVKLDIQVDLEQHADAMNQNTNDKDAAKKRRRSIGSTGSGSNSKKSRRSAVLSTNSLMMLWNQVATLQKGYDHAQAVLNGASDSNKFKDGIETLVGDELLQSYNEVVNMERAIDTQRRELQKIAQQRKALEQECVRYLPWLERMLTQDADDVKFCEHADEQLKTLHFVHGVARKARDERLAEEFKKQQMEEARRRKAEEEEERRKFMEMAMKKETEAKPGQVWNKATGEYQYLHTDESWRD